MKRFALTLAAGLLVLAVASTASAARYPGPPHSAHGRYAYKAPHHGAYQYGPQVRHHGYQHVYRHVPRPYGPYPPIYRAPYHGVYRPVYPGCGVYPYGGGGVHVRGGGVHVGGPNYSFGVHW